MTELYLFLTTAFHHYLLDLLPTIVIHFLTRGNIYVNKIEIKRKLSVYKI